jgi:hypothetical protein
VLLDDQASAAYAPRQARHVDGHEAVVDARTRSAIQRQVGGSRMKNSADEPGDLGKMIADQMEEVLVTVIEGVRERPIVAASIVAGIVGAFIGIMLARVRRPKRRVPETLDFSHGLAAVLRAAELDQRSRALSRRLRKSARTVGERSSRALSEDLFEFFRMADLAPTAMRLLQNPIVRSYIRAAIVSRVARRFRD